MKGLLYKDWSLIAGGYKANFLFLLILYGFLIVMARMSFLAYAMVFVLGLYASSTITMDENSDWDTYARTLPVTARQLVLAKYTLTLLLTAASLPLAFLMIALMPDPKPSLTETALGLAAACTVTLVYFSFVIPLSYRFGAAKARSWVSISILVVAFGPVLLLNMLPDSLTLPLRNALQAADATVTATWSEVAFTAATIGGFLALAVVSLLISGAISVHIYQKKTC